MKSLYVIGLCLALLISAIPAFSQTNGTGAITGRAQDSSGAVIPGVEVTITSPAMIGGARTTVTDEAGVYRFTLLALGTYRVSFALPGFKTINFDGVLLTSGITMTQNGSMEVSTTAEEVTVTSQAPTIDLESATVGVNWSQKMIEDLPWSRSITGISQMIPGTYATSYDIGNSSFGSGSSISARSGGRSGGGVVTIDGLAWCQTYEDYGSFEEMGISTTSKGADQMNSGITIAMVAKSGGNQFHGDWTTNYQNGSMQSNNITPALATAGLVGSNKYTHFRDYYGDIGGPVLKDRFWFYISYRDGYQGTNIPGFLSGVGGTNAVFWTKLRDPSAKLTYQITAKQKLEAYWGLGDKWQPYRGASGLVPQDATQDQNAWSDQGPVFTYTNIINNRTTATAKLSRGGYWWPAYAYSMPAGQGLTLGLANGTTQPMPLVDSVGVKNVGVRVTDGTSKATDGGYLPNYTRPIRWQWNIDVSRVTTIAGKANEIKVGYMGWWDKSYTLNFGYPYQEQYNYKSLPADTCPNGYICSNFFKHPDSVTVYDYPSTSSAGGKYKAGYLNDKITLSRRLTVNVGVRWDGASSFLSAQGNPGTGPYAVKNTIPYSTSITNPGDGSVATFPVYNLFSPRISFAYDVTGTGRIALKASYGRYIGINSGPNSQPGPGANSNGLNPLSAKNCKFTNWDGTIPYVPNFGAQNYLGSPTNVNLSGTCSGGVSPNTIHQFDSNLSPSYLNEYAAGVDIGLNRNYSFRFNFSRKFDYGNGQALSSSGGSSATMSKAVNVLTPYSSYTDIRCAVDPGPDAKLGTADDGANVCTYSVPLSNANRTVTDILYAKAGANEGVSGYTAFNVTFNKQFSNKWSFLAGYGVDLGHPGFYNALTPNDTLYQATAGLTTWSQSWKMNGTYDLPSIPLFRGHSFAGLKWSSVYTAQSGDWYSRSFDVKDAAGNTQTLTVNGHAGRYPWVKDWDQSIAKRFKITDTQSVQITWQLFNTLNASTITGFSSTDVSSSTYLQPDKVTPLQPKNILPGRIYQWGISYKF